MKAHVLIAEFCVAFLVLDGMPASGDAIDGASFTDLPINVQEAVLAKMPSRSVGRVKTASKHLMHVAMPHVLGQALYAEYGKEAIQKSFAMGIKDLDVYDALLDLSGPHDGNHDRAAHQAGRAGDVGKLMAWAEKFHRMPVSAYVGAAEKGDAAAFQAVFARYTNLIALRDAVEEAGKRGKTDFLRALYEHFASHDQYWIFFKQPLTFAVQFAVQNGHVDVFDAVMELEQGPNWRNGYVRKALNGAARAGNLESVQRFMALHTVNQHSLKDVYEAAGEGGNLAVLEYLDTHPMPQSALMEALAGAVRNNHHEAFKYISEQHPHWTLHVDHAYAEAIRHGRGNYEDGLAVHATLDGVVRALILINAAETGDAAAIDRVLLRHNGFIPAGVMGQVVTAAAESGHWDVMQQLAARFPPLQSDVNQAFKGAVMNGHLDIAVRMLKDGLGNVMPDACVAAAVGDGRRHPSLAFATSQLLALAKCQSSLIYFVKGLTPATRLVFADAIPRAISIAERDEFAQDEVQFLHELGVEFQH